jgi:hypothetical protein
MKLAYMDRMKFAAYMAYSFFILFHNLLVPFLSVYIYGFMYDLYSSSNIVRMIKS